jgi:hypothetical protein
LGERILNTKSSVFVVLVASLALGCGWQAQRREVLRAPSPDGRLEVVVEEVNPSGLSDYEFHVHVVLRGEPTENGRAVAVFESVKSTAGRIPAVRWDAANSLVLSFKKAKVFGYRNNWHDIHYDSGSSQVEIRLEHPPRGFVR